MERTEAGHKQWQESGSQGPQAGSSCQQEKRIDNKQLTEMVTIRTLTASWGHRPVSISNPSLPTITTLIIASCLHFKTSYVRIRALYLL